MTGQPTAGWASLVANTRCAAAGRSRPALVSARAFALLSGQPFFRSLREDQRTGIRPELSRFVHREREADRDGLVQRYGGRRESSVPGAGGSRGAGLVGEDNGLHPVAQPELAQDPGHVGLNGGLAQHQLRGELGIAQAPG
jgi:hypothetical protein